MQLWLLIIIRYYAEITLLQYIRDGRRRETAILGNEKDRENIHRWCAGAGYGVFGTPG